MDFFQQSPPYLAHTCTDIANTQTQTFSCKNKFFPYCTGCGVSKDYFKIIIIQINTTKKNSQIVQKKERDFILGSYTFFCLFLESTSSLNGVSLLVLSSSRLVLYWVFYGSCGQSKRASTFQCLITQYTREMLVGGRGCHSPHWRKRKKKHTKKNK